MIVLLKCKYSFLILLFYYFTLAHVLVSVCVWQSIKLMI